MAISYAHFTDDSLSNANPHLSDINSAGTCLELLYNYSLKVF